MKFQQLMIAVLLLGVGLVAGWWWGTMNHEAGSMEMSAAGDGPCAGGAQPAHWAAPMDPGFQRDKPGKSPMGMDLVPVCPGGGPAGADVQIDPAIEQNLGLRTARVQRRALSRPVRAVGSVAYDENSYRMIHSRTEGWIERFGVETEGAAVEQDQLLYELFSPKLVAAEREYLTARQSGRAALMAAARDRLRSLGYGPEQIERLTRRNEVSDRLLRTAPADAVVAMLGAREGQFVTPGTHIMTLASLDRVWVLVDLLERDAGRVRAGMPAAARVDAFPGREWQGHVDYVYPQIDARTRTLRVRLVFDNADRALRPNMFARATIATDPVADALVVPASAVIRSGQGERVVTRVGAGRFDVVAVQTGLRSGDEVQILRGLAAGDEVVIAGQFLIDSEANLDAEALRLEAAIPEGSAVGTIVALDTEKERIRLRHGPIEPLGDGGLKMPGMTMDFELGVEPGRWQAGDEVRVTVTQPGQGRYRVTRLQPAVQPATLEHAGDAMQHAGSPAPSHGSTDTMAGHDHPSAMTAARVVDVDAAARRLTLAHERIESLGMPAMTMSFAVADGVAIHALQADDRVRFAVEHGADGMRITALEVLE